MVITSSLYFLSLESQTISSNILVNGTKQNTSLYKHFQINETTFEYKNLPVCDMHPYAKIIATGGFYTIIPRNGSYEFVLKPGTIGYMTMIYNFPQNTTQSFLTQFRSTFADLLSTRIYTLDDPNTPHSSTEGIKIFPINVINDTENSIYVTYVINSSKTQGIYLLGTFFSCPGEIITIGEKPFQGNLPWSHPRY